MNRRLAIFTAIALAAASLAGCAAPGGGSGSSSAPYGSPSSPYDGVESSACGALGNCPATRPLRINKSDLAGG